MLTLTHLSRNVSGCTSEFDTPNDRCLSGEALPDAVKVKRDSERGVVLHARIFSSAVSDESDCTD